MRTVKSGTIWRVSRGLSAVLTAMMVTFPTRPERRQGLFGLHIVGAERYEGGKAGISRGYGAQLIAVAPVQVDVAVDQAGQDVLALGVDVAVGWRQQLLGTYGCYLLTGDCDRSVVDLRGSNDVASPYYSVNSSVWHVLSPALIAETNINAPPSDAIIRDEEEVTTF